jgi:hypothetical protein
VCCSFQPTRLFLSHSLGRPCPACNTLLSPVFLKSHLSMPLRRGHDLVPQFEAIMQQRGGLTYTVFVTAPSHFPSSPHASVRQTHAAVARRDFLVKVVIKTFFSVMLQDTRNSRKHTRVKVRRSVMGRQLCDCTRQPVRHPRWNLDSWPAHYRSLRTQTRRRRRLKVKGR